MKFFYLFILMIGFPLMLKGQYVCTPCNLDCDTLNFAAPGVCPHCQMALIPAIQDSMATDTILERIDQAIKANTQVMRWASFLSDVYGPRLMGTPNYYESVRWAERELKSWGIDQITLPSFDREYIGWEAKDFGAKMLEPITAPLHVYPLAYSSSTEGEVTGETMIISSFEDINSHIGQLKGKIILLKNYYRPARNMERPMSSRLTDERLKQAADNPDPNHVIVGYHSRRSSVDVFGRRARIKRARKQFYELCEKEGVLAVFEPSDFPYGILHVDGNRILPSFTKKEDIRPIASFVLANEHFGRLLRLTELGLQPRVKVHLEVERFDRPEYNVNLVADLIGSDPVLQKEMVIIGAHLDSWHGGTGAVDNASNCAVMMEALRLLKVSGLRPRRSIRLILWGGEEQEFAGSSFYVDERVAKLETVEPQAEYNRISAYLNLDNGAGMIRGVYLMGNPAVQPYFADYLQLFPKSQTLTIQNANQTDHEFFDYLNIPAFQFIQDPLDYMTAIHHTNMDVYEYIPEADQKYNARLMAYLAYRIAEEDNQLPRKSFNSPIPSREGNVLFELEGHKEAKKVYLVGDFNQWNLFGTPLYRTEKGWATKIDLPSGNYYYKFIIDGYWTADPKTPEEELVKDGKGHGGLTILKVE